MKNVAPMPGRPVRGSATGRPIMAALDLFGRRGLLRILWELRGDAPLTFRALAGATDLPPSTLNARLKELRAAGLLDSGAGYALTPLGRDLLTALDPLVLWSETWARSLPPPEAKGG